MDFTFDRRNELFPEIRLRCHVTIGLFYGDKRGNQVAHDGIG
jgi:hypothetical protein